MAPAALATEETTLDDLREGLRRGPGTLFAVLDACDEPKVPDKVQGLGNRAVSLYRGWAERDFWAIAPYLVEVDEPLLDWIAENLWQEPWGIFAFAPADLASLRTHFRRFLLVKGPDGEDLYFRFYDPRVLPTFLTTCNESEAAGFFGPIRSFSVKGEGEGLIRFSLAADRD